MFIKYLWQKRWLHCFSLVLTGFVLFTGSSDCFGSPSPASSSAVEPFNAAADMTASTDPLDNWKTRVFAEWLNGIAYGNGTYVAVSISGSAVLTSPDKREWTKTAYTKPEPFGPTEYGISDIIYFNGKFISVGSPSGNTVFSSTNGTTWTAGTGETRYSLNSITTGPDVTFGSGNGPIALALGGGIIKSADGSNWTLVADGETNYDLTYFELHGAAYGTNSRAFVLAGGGVTSYGGKIFTYDVLGVTKRLDLGGGGPHLYGVAYGNNAFVVVGERGTIYRSVNTAHGKKNNEGTSWTLQTSNTAETLRGVAYGNNTFVAVGTNSVVLTSPDGAAWSARSFKSPVTAWSVRFINGEFVVTGYGGAILTSPDGITWTSWMPDSAHELGSVVYGGSGFVAVGNSGTIMTSPDGVNWTSRATGTEFDLYGVSYGSDTYVAVGYAGLVLTSPDGATWTLRSSGTTQNLWRVVYGNGMFVATGSGVSAVSLDGMYWNVYPEAISPFVMAFGNGLFFGPASSSSIATSPDGSAWTPHALDGAMSPWSMAFGNNVMVATGYYGSVATSSGSQYWTARTFGTTNGLAGVGFGNNTFVAVGYNTILSSNDGRTWNTRLSGGTAGYLTSVAFGNNTFVAVTGTYGALGTILQTPKLPEVAAPAPEPEISISPVSLSFGSVKRGSSSTKQTITVKNVWTGNLHMTSQVTGTNPEDFVVAGTCGPSTSVGPDQSCTFDVHFSPTGAFSRTAMLALSTNDPNRATVNIPLSGIGLQPIMGLSATALDFGPVYIGILPAYKSLTISNTGNNTLMLSDFSIGGENAAEFSIYPNSNNCSWSYGVRANGSCSMLLTFRPADVGPRSATLNITANDPDKTNPVTVLLSGIGVTP